MQDNFTCYSHGKLLLTAEYLVLDGAKALALPCAFGQFFKVNAIDEPKLIWKSFTFEGNIWFQQDFKIQTSSVEPLKKGSRESIPISLRIQQLFKSLLKLNPDLFSTYKGLEIETLLEFPISWGLGSSSTLINNLAQWANVDPYLLLKESFGGSGYDIACAANNKPLLFQLKDDKPTVEKVSFKPSFKKELFFVHLNKKKNSREAIQHYKQQDLSKKEKWADKASSLSLKFLNCTNLAEFESLIETHESLLSSILKLPTIKTTLFPDYPKAIKSLGGWGGDFILATGGEEEKNYFRAKNYQTIIDYKKMVL